MIRPLAGAAFLAVLAAFVPSGTPTPAQQPASKPLSAELTYVPSDAALFVHVDVAQVWNGPVVKAIREADAKSLDEVVTNVKTMFGASPDSLESLTMFWPKFSSEKGVEAFGVAAVFKAPFDKAKLEAGFAKVIGPQAKTKVVKVTDTLAVLLCGLDAETYGVPQPQKDGPQTAALREAASRKHILSVGIAPLQFPDEIRGDNLPQEVRAIQPLFHAESIGAFIALDKELSVDIRVKSKTPPRAREVEKSLGFIAEFSGNALGEGLKMLRKDAAENKDARDLIAILAALQTATKEAKFTTEGETTRMTAKAPADLPLASALLAAKKKVQQAAARATSSNNLKQIALAFHNYESTNFSFPPAAVCDKNGKPMLSWRVLILPYIEQDELYKQFKLDEPWDSENNKKLIAKMPKIYGLPGISSPKPDKPDQTHYRLFVGNGAGHDYLKGARPQDFADGTSNTILVITAKDSVIWTKPDELDFDPNKDMTKLLGLFHGGVCTVAFADGSVRALSPKITKAALHGYITRNGAEVVNDDE